MEKTNKITFQDYYFSLSPKEKRELRKTFIEASGIEYPTFFSKLTRSNYSNLEKKELEKLTGKTFSWDRSI